MSATGTDIRNDWTCPDCGARAVDGRLHYAPAPPVDDLRNVASPPLHASLVVCANGHTQPMPEGAYVVFSDDEMAAFARSILAARGWETERVSCYDEECVEGWEWDADGDEVARYEQFVRSRIEFQPAVTWTLGDWSDPPEMPEGLMAYALAQGEPAVS